MLLEELGLELVVMGKLGSLAKHIRIKKISEANYWQLLETEEDMRMYKVWDFYIDICKRTIEWGRHDRGFNWLNEQKESWEDHKGKVDALLRIRLSIFGVDYSLLKFEFGFGLSDIFFEFVEYGNFQILTLLIY